MKYLAAFLILTSLGACATLRGAGQDISTGGEVVGDTIQGVGEGISGQ